jgi:hypothetical protein
LTVLGVDEEEEDEEGVAKREAREPEKSTEELETVSIAEGSLEAKKTIPSASKALLEMAVPVSCGTFLMIVCV